MEPGRPAAYHGPGWRQRDTTLAREIREGRIWTPYVVDSEWSRLRHVLLYVPGPGVGALGDPDGALHLGQVDAAALRRQHDALCRAYADCGVEVHLVSGDGVDDSRRPNLMFQRDTFWQTFFGAVVARMASPVRAGEERHATLALADLGVPVALTVGGAATFEGADALWIDPRHVLCGLGRRTNADGLARIRQALDLEGVRCTAVPVPDGVQHLLGCVQIVSPERVLVRTELASTELVDALRAAGLEVLPVAESEEVRRHQAFNFVVVDRDRVVLAAEADAFRRRLEANGIDVAAAVPCSEYARAAGGLACATGILARDPVASPEGL
jgi:N-dimethylarginine dimethylaminohydrolase